MGGLLLLSAVAVLHEHGAQGHEAHDGNDQEHDDLDKQVGTEQVRSERCERADDEPHGDEAERHDFDDGHDGGHGQPDEGAHGLLLSPASSIPSLVFGVREARKPIRNAGKAAYGRLGGA